MKRGFTLIELMIVVAIIAIIAAIAIPSLMEARIASNETAAAATVKAIATAEAMFIKSDFDKDGVFEYASKIGGTYSLYRDNAGVVTSLIDKAYAIAEGEPGGNNYEGSTVQPNKGYVYKILTAAGAFAPGGTKVFITGGKMTQGFAASGHPSGYRSDGRSTFMIGVGGTVYQCDRGATATTHPDTFDPDSTWATQ